MTENLIAPTIPFEEAAVEVDVFESILSFARSNKTMSLSFNVIVNGAVERFTLYRFVDEDTKRTNVFLHHTSRGYFEVSNISPYGNPRNPTHVGIKTSGLLALSIYPVEDLEKFRLNALIQHVMTNVIYLQAQVDEEDKDTVELIFEYLKMLEEKYK